MFRILPVLRVSLLATLCIAAIAILTGCGLKGELFLPDDADPAAEARNEAAASEAADEENGDQPRG